MADCFTRDNEKVMMFDLGNAEFFMNEVVEKLAQTTTGEEVVVWKEVSRLLQPESWRDFGKDCLSHATTGRHWLARSLDNWQTGCAGFHYHQERKSGQARTDFSSRRVGSRVRYASRRA